jgi:lactoylglutathione lyase
LPDPAVRDGAALLYKASRPDRAATAEASGRLGRARTGNLMCVPATLRCEIFPGDLDVTADFYTNVLGFRIVSDRRDSEAPYLALERGEVRLGAARRPPAPAREARRPPIGVELVLEVDDLLGDRARVRAAGWPVAEEVTARPWGPRDFRLLDPDGHYWRVTTRT